MKRYTLKLLSIFMILCIMSTLCTFFTTSATVVEFDPALEKYITEFKELDEKTRRDLLDDYLYYYFCVYKEDLLADELYDSFDDFYYLRSEDITVSDAYGPFNGAYVFILSVILDGNGVLVVSDSIQYVGNYAFKTKLPRQHYVVWKDRKIQRLDNAYIDGVITDEDLDILAKLTSRSTTNKTIAITDEARKRTEESKKVDYYTNALEIKTAYLDYYKDTHKELPEDFSNYHPINVTLEKCVKIFLIDSNNNPQQYLLLSLRGDFEELSEESGTEIVGDYVFLQQYKNIRYFIWKDRKLQKLSDVITEGCSIEEQTFEKLASYNMARERLPGETAPPTLTTTTTAVTTTSTVAATSTTLAASTTASSTNTETSPTVPTSTPKTNDMPIYVILILSALSLVAISLIIIVKRSELRIKN